MRWTNTLRNVLLFFGSCALLFTGVYYGIPLLDMLPKFEFWKYAIFIGMPILILGIGSLLLYIPTYALMMELSEWASGVQEVYMDVNQKDIHLFTYHKISRAKTGESTLHLLQHYFIKTESGKSYYNTLFSFSVRSASGRSGVEGYTTFEETVMPSEELAKSLEKLSRKLRWKPELGEKIRSDGEDGEGSYKISPGRELVIDKVEKILGYRFTAFHMDAVAKKVLWKIKL